MHLLRRHVQRRSVRILQAPASFCGAWHDLLCIMPEELVEGPLCIDLTSTAVHAEFDDSGGGGGNGSSQQGGQPRGGGAAGTSMGVGISRVPTMRSPLMDSNPAADPGRGRVSWLMYSSAVVLCCVTVLILVLPFSLAAPLPSPPLELLLAPLFIFLLLICFALSPALSPAFSSPASNTHPP